MTKLLRTVTAPESKLPPALHVPDLVTALREYGTVGEHSLPLTQSRFSIGSSPSCDIWLASEYVSAIHCTLVRREQSLRVQDLGSHNGSYFRGRKETAFAVEPGDTFSVATTRLIALNDHMRLARPILTEVLGRDRETLIDDVLVASILDGPLLVTGPRGACQMDLVRAIHDMSIRRNQLLLDATLPPPTREKQKQLIVGAQRGTMILTATGEPFDDAFLDTVLSADFGTRLVLLSPTLQMAVRSLKLGRLPFMTRIDIRPLRERPGEIEELLELHFAKYGSCIRLADLSPDNREMLLHHNWPDNLEELRQIAAIIAAILRQGSIRKASDALKMPRSTMQYWIKRFQLTFPLMAPPSPPPLAERSDF